MKHENDLKQTNKEKRLKNKKLKIVLVSRNKRVTKIENIKTDSTKILRPTHFLFLNMLLSLT
jgi:hypothetical protein